MSQSNLPPTETDDRFPSGPWKGYFLHRSSNQEKWRMELHLSFSSRRVRGNGCDAVGEFVIDGRYDLDDGKVWWTKRYSSHEVLYQGYAEGGKIWGTWEIQTIDRDGFQIWPLGSEHDEAHLVQHESPTIGNAEPFLESETAIAESPDA